MRCMEVFFFFCIAAILYDPPQNENKNKNILNSYLCAVSLYTHFEFRTKREKRKV